jgi:hypothetical protein
MSILISSSALIRLGAMGFVAGGVVWIVGYLLSFGIGSGRVAFALVVSSRCVWLLLTILGMVGLHALQKGRYRLTERVGFYAVLVGCVAWILAEWGVLFKNTTFLWLLLPIGELGISVTHLGISVGFVLYGAATLRAGLLPRWYGVTLFFLVPGSLALLVYGNEWLELVSNKWATLVSDRWLGLVADLWLGLGLVVLGFGLGIQEKSE